MEHTVSSLARLSGVSPRTLRYYDEIGLLTPRRAAPSGYRVYGAQEVDILQQILLYRELGLPLECIRELITAPEFDPLHALLSHRSALLAERERLDRLLSNVEKTISHMKEGSPMEDRERFEGLKEQMILQNETQYGKEVRERWGAEAMDASNGKLKGMDRQAFDAQQQLAQEVLVALKAALATGDTHGAAAKEMVALHKRWLGGWGDYPKEAHQGLGDMYVADERFSKYYEDAAGAGAAQFLWDAIYAYYEE